MKVLEPLRRFGSGEDMSPPAGGAALRLAFAGLFWGQSALALLVGAVVAWVAAPSGANGVLGAVLVTLGVLQGPLGLVAGLAPLPEPEHARRAALHRTLLAAVLLSTPAWYLAFLVATGAAGWSVIALLALLGVYGGLGILLASRLGARAV